MATKTESLPSERRHLDKEEGEREKGKGESNGFSFPETGRRDRERERERLRCHFAPPLGKKRGGRNPATFGGTTPKIHLKKKK